MTAVYFIRATSFSLNARRSRLAISSSPANHQSGGLPCFRAARRRAILPTKEKWNDTQESCYHARRRASDPRWLRKARGRGVKKSFNGRGQLRDNSAYRAAVTTTK